jgi:small-conductance mechanosensitive channel
LLSSLAVIRVVFYVLRVSLVGAAWLVPFERVFAVLVWGVVALHITGLLPEAIDVLESITFTLGKQKLTLWHVLQGIAAVLTTVLVALWLSSAIEARLQAATGLDNNLRAVFARLSRALLVLLAVLIGLPMVGIDLTTLSVFGGALGVGLGLGLQKIASNYVSGFIILLDNSIRIGNIITVGADRGEVTRITTRYTVLKNLSGVEALVPNELLIGSVVQNESYSEPQVRVALPVQVSYDSDLERAMAIMKAAAQAQPRVLAEPASAVLLKEFAESGINLELGFWVADPAAGVAVLCSNINLAIWRDFKQAGIAIPFPQREIRILKGPGND